MLLPKPAIPSSKAQVVTSKWFIGITYPFYPHGNCPHPPPAVLATVPCDVTSRSSFHTIGKTLTLIFNCGMSLL